MKKITKIFATSLFALTALAGVSLTSNNAVNTVKEVDAETTHGYLNIYLYCYWLNGTSDQRNANDASRKFNYDSLLEAYTLDFVLYEGDYFAPYVLQANYMYFNQNVTQEAVDKFAENNLVRNVSNNYFTVLKTGTYHFQIGTDVETTASGSFPLLWNDTENNFIEYKSESTDFKTPLGTYTYWLYGAFDGAAMNTTDLAERRFYYNDKTKCYELTYGLYAGDIFVPYQKSPATSYVTYFKSAYTDEQLEKNNLSYNSNNYFVAKKDGTYKISLTYKEEYYTNKAFGWSKDGGSSITYVSSELPEKSVLGNEEIVLTGTFSGNSVSQSSSTYKFTYVPGTKTYDISVKLAKNDFFTAYMKKKGSYIAYLVGDTYASSMYAGAGLSSYTSGGRVNFLVKYPGTYKISIGANVENLANATDCWRTHGNSSIRFAGNETKAVYVLLGNRSDGKNLVYTDAGSSSPVKQYGINGTYVNPVAGVKFNGKVNSNLSGSYVRIGYDEAYSNKFKLTSIKDDQVILEHNLVDGFGFTLDGDMSDGDAYIGEACNFISFLKSKFTNITVNGNTYSHFKNMDEDDARAVIASYKGLSSNAKTYVDNTLFTCVTDSEEMKDYTTDEIMTTLNKITSNSKQIIITVAIAVGMVVVLGLLFIILAAFKRNSDEADPSIAKEDKKDSIDAI